MAKHKKWILEQISYLNKKYGISGFGTIRNKKIRSMV